MDENAGLAGPAMVGHQIRESWMGESLVTLADLIPPNPKAVCVGINPSPVSVLVGHYYQGRLGQRIFARLRQAGLMADHADGYEDDDAYRRGIGFTDIVKRPTARAADVSREEYVHGRAALAERLRDANAQLVIFTFKKAATAYFGDFTGGGFVNDLRVGPAQVFVLPGAMESTTTAEAKLATLAAHLRR